LYSAFEIVNFTVDTSVALDITYISPEQDSVVSELPGKITVITNKLSSCLYGVALPNTGTGTFQEETSVHVSEDISFEPGYNTYVFQCTRVGSSGAEFVSAEVDFLVDTTPPDRPIVRVSAAENTDDDVTYYSDRLIVDISTELMPWDSMVLLYALRRLSENSFYDQSMTQFCSPSLRLPPGPPPGLLTWISDCSGLRPDPSLSLLPSTARSQQSDLTQIPATTPFTVSYLLPVFVMPSNPEDLTRVCFSDPTTHQLPRDYFHPVAQPPFFP